MQSRQWGERRYLRVRSVVLKIPPVRLMAASIRFSRSLMRVESIRAFKKSLLLHRTRILIRPFSVIETLTPDSKILVVGPRSEDDLLHLGAISYFPNVDLGDMHRMPYPDETETFDTVIYGWVLSYSVDPQRAATEAIRVVKEGGIVAIGAEHHPNYNEAELSAQGIARLGYPVGGKIINSAV